MLWEKTALSFKFLVEKIAIASLKHDKDFFERLAKAIKQKVAHKSEIRNQHYKEALQFLIPFFKVKYGFNERKIWQRLNKERKGGTIADIMREVLFKEEDVSSLDDIDYFVKFLKRNKFTP